MVDSKDICLIVVMANIGFFTTLLFGQMARVVTGVPGSNYVFIILLTIQTSFSFQIYEGRRWRVFIQGVIFTILIIPLNFGGTPYNVISKMNYVITPLICDVIFNSLYGIFRRYNKLFLWGVLTTVVFWALNPFLGALTAYVVQPIEYVMAFLNVVLLLLPLIIIESVVGGYIGYKIYLRVKRDVLLNTDEIRD
ncbi:MAG: hypothetical protein CW691_11605 [Candidatus Bathyarchaeum sp.]|nr:MAG: hypothetical protein CW691_11605 [Candidatus Bathyarchaeum sp.]